MCGSEVNKDEVIEGEVVEPVVVEYEVVEGKVGGEWGRLGRGGVRQDVESEIMEGGVVETKW